MPVSEVALTKWQTEGFLRIRQQRKRMCGIDSVMLEPVLLPAMPDLSSFETDTTLHWDMNAVEVVVYYTSAAIESGKPKRGKDGRQWGRLISNRFFPLLHCCVV